MICSLFCLLTDHSYTLSQDLCIPLCIYVCVSYLENSKYEGNQNFGRIWRFASFFATWRWQPVSRILSLSISVYLSTYIFIYLSIYLPIYLFTYLPIYLCFYLPIYFFYLSATFQAILLLALWSCVTWPASCGPGTPASSPGSARSASSSSSHRFIGSLMYWGTVTVFRLPKYAFHTRLYALLGFEILIWPNVNWFLCIFIEHKTYTSLHTLAISSSHLRNGLASPDLLYLLSKAQPYFPPLFT